MLVLEKNLNAHFRFEIYNDLPTFDVLQVNQIHSNIVFNSELIHSNELPDADGIISLDLETPIAIKTADCLPIVLIGKKGVALLHAGWRGLQGKIIADKNVQAINPFQAFVGPFIHAQDYEVGQEFIKNFPNSDAFCEFEGRICFDLLTEAANQILDCYNIPLNNEIAQNTFMNKHLNSYRRDKTKTRNWNILRKIKI